MPVDVYNVRKLIVRSHMETFGVYDDCCTRDKRSMDDNIYEQMMRVATRDFHHCRISSSIINNACAPQHPEVIHCRCARSTVYYCFPFG